MAYRVTLVEGRSFVKIHDLPIEDLTWKRLWNTGHQASFSFKVSELDQKPELVRGNIWPLEYWIVVQWDNTPIYAALITDHQYKRSSRTVTVPFADIWYFWDRRHVLGNRTADAATYSFDWKNISYQTMAIRAVKMALLEEEGSGMLWDLPIVFPAETSGTVNREVWGYNFETVKEILDEASQAGEFNIDFRPRWSANDTLEWVMELDGSGTTLEYDLDAAISPVTDLDYNVVGAQLTNHVFGIGEGSEEDMLVRVSTKPSQTNYPAFESTVDGKNVDTRERLQALTTAHRFAHDATIRQATLKVLADGPPHVGQFRLGSTIRWRAEDDPYVPSQWHEQTVVEFSGSLQPEVSISMTDWGG